jgi:hypothetical protein
MRIVLAAALLIGMSQPALCGAVTDFLKIHDEPLGGDTTETQLMGIQKGFIATNMFLRETRKEAPLYCQPETLSLTAGQLVDMLRRGLKEQPDLDDTNLAPAMLAVMQHTFPCTQDLK